VKIGSKTKREKNFFDFKDKDQEWFLEKATFVPWSIVHTVLCFSFEEFSYDLHVFYSNFVGTINV
jgi:hypothetical protein